MKHIRFPESWRNDNINKYKIVMWQQYDVAVNIADISNRKESQAESLEPEDRSLKDMQRGCQMTNKENK